MDSGRLAESTEDCNVGNFDNAEVAKWQAIFRRRVQQGQCFRRPALGCREFVSYFSKPDGDERPIDQSMDLGTMLYDIKYSRDGSGRGEPSFKNLVLDRGVVRF